MSDDLLRYRAEFPILDTTTYLISNSLGAMPRGVADAMREYTDVWAARGVRAPRACASSVIHWPWNSAGPVPPKSIWR